MSAEPVLEVEDLVQEFRPSGTWGLRWGRPAATVHAVSGVSFQVREGETLGIVGETGCGKSSLARAIIRIPPPKSGRVLLRGRDLATLRGSALREARREIQMVFQDPFSSLDPRWSARDLVAEPLLIHGVGDARSRRARADELMHLVGLDPSIVGRRRIRELSGGQCQRVAIARALALSPKVVILDEPVSSLDVSVQAQVLNLLEALRAQLGLSYLFISHDLSVVRHVSDRVCVMYLGKLVEVADSSDLYRAPLHPYARQLMSAVPDPRARVQGTELPATALSDPPSPLNPPSGCRYRTRCDRAQDVCAAVEPELTVRRPAHRVACHFPLDEPAGAGP
jgi:peptide/nickel transport system ATP-binding protein